jgi:uncharacterized protein (TIGR03066 family)
MNKVRLALAGALVLGLAVAARADEKGGTSDLQKKLVGKWEVIKFKAKDPKDKGPPPGTMIEFTRDGKVILTAEEKGEKVRREATYKVEGKGFTLTVKHGDKEETQTIKVLRADDKGLVLRNEKQGHEVTLRRKGARPKD